ncbi:unnamed protein product [Rotaria socialis]|uniref:Beta-lactamase-related domain-containing protein n=2 Tax=Rotaria socialis TaxID=392032 RepID=A0A820MSQ4_9BILA|nr:unnamed protein product [Rotaria socialis]
MIAPVTIKTSFFSYTDDDTIFTVLNCIDFCVTVVAYVPNSTRSLQLLDVIDLSLPKHLEYLKDRTNKNNSKNHDREELKIIEKLSTTIKKTVEVTAKILYGIQLTINRHSCITYFSNLKENISESSHSVPRLHALAFPNIFSRAVIKLVERYLLTIKNQPNLKALTDKTNMGVFNRFYFLGKPLALCGTAGFLWAQLNNDNDIDKEKLKLTINQADLICQGFKEKQGIPGVSIGVTMHGSFVWRKGYGLADIEQRVPCTPDTVMRIASISKTFTATLAAQFVEKGKLNWNDKIDKYHPDLPKFLFENVPVSITVRQLASHTSGIRHYWKKGDPETDAEFNLPEYYIARPFPTVTESLSLFVNDELLHKPGTTWLYTTHGYTLLSAILERISDDKHSYAELLNDLITKQLDLRNTKLEYPDEIVPNRSRYYWRRSLKEGLRNVAYVDLSYKWAGGGILSNVTDLLLYANNLLQCRQTKLVSSDSNKQLLKSETIRELWSPIVATNRKNTSYGLGWMIAKEQPSSINQCSIPSHIYHTGGAVGATSIILIIPCSNNCSNPRCGICISILTNLQSAREIYQTALDIALLFRHVSSCSNDSKL